MGTVSEFVMLPSGEVVRRDSVVSVSVMEWVRNENGDFEKYRFFVRRRDCGANGDMTVESYSYDRLDILNDTRNWFISQLGQEKFSLTDIHRAWIDINGR